MARASFVRRHRAVIASGASLAVALGAVLVYVVTADGYKSHEAELNDGGVWVVNGTKGWSGRLNKPINQLDGVVPGEGGDTRLDVVQDGAAVVTVNLDASRGQSIATARLEAQDGGAAAIPAGGDLAMGGGTLASADPESGKVWAVRYDSQVGEPVMSSVDRQSKVLATAGKGAAMTVTQDGVVVATSTEDGTVTTIAPAGTAFGEPATRDLSSDAGEVSQVTAVGERVVTLDEDSGSLSVIGGPSASVPTGSVLQQAGPEAGAVLVTTPESLVEVDLVSGDVTTLATASGRPVAPVRLGACVFGAWAGGRGAVATGCGSAPADVKPLDGDATELAFRVNRGEIVLNDAPSGTVWDVQQDTPIRIANWNAFTSKKKKDDEDDKNQNQDDADKRPPQAKPDSYGVRAGRTTVLHPLDNDSAPQGRLLSIVDVDQPSGGARVEISPDGQTLVLQMPDEARPATFEYFVDDGRDGLSAHAAVDVRVRRDAENEPPDVREGYERPTYKVPHGGTLAVPVLSDWRDDADGDTLLLDSARAVGGDETGASARTTADGRIRFTAPSTAASGEQVVKVEYAVTDGRSAPARKEIAFQVQAPKDQQSYAASAEPDVVRGEVGKPIKIRPLLNDLPGSDPGNPNAELSLAGKVPQQPDATVVSDLDAGQLTFTGARAGTYFLNYDAGYGNAPPDQGTVRVDVQPPPKRAADPIAMPDTLTIYGQAPGIVDVLANDLDPAGGLLVVQRASGDVEGQLDVAIVDGRWLRISSVQPAIAPATQTVTYTISNGASSSVRGEVVVTQRDVPADNTPITVADKVVVRAGASVQVPVLDNDVSPSGDRLTLVGDLVDESVPAPGQLDVVAPIDVTGDVGRAYASGRSVRYVAPDDVVERDTYTVTYVAQNVDGERANGTLRVTVVPADDPNDPPEPPTLEARVVSGDRVKVRVPGSGVDRNGDPVTVTGITSAPRLGRIMSSGGNFLEYQAYPRTAGTDEFRYSVVDSRGAFATGTVRVAVVSPGQPQPPLAVADRLTVEPGRTATFDPLANDFVGAGDSVDVELVDAPEGVRLDPETRLVTVPAPDSLEAPPVVVVYRVSNGIDESRATMTLETAADYDNPPVVYDAFGRAEDSGAVVVDVLEGAYDPDGDAADLEVSGVFGDPTATVVDGIKVRAERGASPKVLPFEVTDADGSTASASVYVPPTGAGLPYVVPGARIDLDPGDTFSGSLDDFVVAPGGADVRPASGRRSWSASPTAVVAAADGPSGFTVTAPEDYRGWGAVLVEVTTATDAAGNDDASTTDDGATVLLSIPVQVGDDVPTLECPSTVLPISAGQAIDLDVASFCKVFTPDPRDAAGLAYSADLTQPLAGVDAAEPEGSVVRVTAAEEATEGGEAVLTVRAGESNSQEVRFRLGQAEPPTLLPIRVDTMEAGESRTFDIRSYLRSGVGAPSPQIVSVRSTGNPAVKASADGSRLTLTASREARGAAAGFDLVVSDVSSADPPPTRLARGRIRFEVVGVPNAPGPPRPFPVSDEVGAIKMSWKPPTDDGGAPVQYYRVKEERTGSEQKCDTNTCVFRNLRTGGRYSFRVQAVNRVGGGAWSDLSASAQADTTPGRVQAITMKSRGDHLIEISWGKPTTQTSRIQRYLVSYAGLSRPVEVSGDRTSYVATGLDNNARYTFEVKAENRVGVSLARYSDELQPLGTPTAPAAPTVTDLETGNNQSDFRIAWQDVAPEGPGPTAYTVTYSTGGRPVAVTGCQKIVALTCTHSGVPYDGSTYNYQVTAVNQPSPEPGNRSPASAATAIQAVGRPAQWGAFQVYATGNTQEAEVRYTVPDSRGETSRVEILVNGQVAKSFGQQTGSAVTRFPTPGNEQPSQVQLRVCNERAPVGCTVSPAASVQTYGRLEGMLNDIGPASVNGKTLTWTITGTSNGDAAQLVVRFNGGGEQVVNLTPAGAFSQQVSFDAADFDQTVVIDVRLQDASPANRGTASKGRSDRSGPPPPPSVRVTRGDSCSDAVDSTLPDCQQNGGQPECVDAGCARVRFVVNGLRIGDRVECTVDNSQDPWWNANERTWGWWYADTDRNVPIYFRGGLTTALCTWDRAVGDDSNFLASPGQW